MNMRMAIKLLIVLLVAPAALAVDHIVGDSLGWNSGVDYNSWTDGKTFSVGDTLLFTYGPSHSIDVVDRRGYDNCDPTRATDSFQGGNTTLTLRQSGPLFFICPTPGHCAGGMKLAVNITRGSSSPLATAPTPPATSPTPEPGTPTSSPSPAGSPSSTPSPSSDSADGPEASSPEEESTPTPTPAPGQAPGTNGASILSRPMILLTVVLGSVISFMS